MRRFLLSCVLVNAIVFPAVAAPPPSSAGPGDVEILVDVTKYKPELSKAAAELAQIFDVPAVEAAIGRFNAAQDEKDAAKADAALRELDALFAAMETGAAKAARPLENAARAIGEAAEKLRDRANGSGPGNVSPANVRAAHAASDDIARIRDEFSKLDAKKDADRIEKLIKAVKRAEGIRRAALYDSGNDGAGAALGGVATGYSTAEDALLDSVANLQVFSIKVTNLRTKIKEIRDIGAAVDSFHELTVALGGTKGGDSGIAGISNMVANISRDLNGMLSHNLEQIDPVKLSPGGVALRSAIDDAEALRILKNETAAASKK